MYNEIIIKDPPYLKRIATLPRESECWETSDKLKQLSSLTVNFNLVHYS